jgi:hypothetical protein
VLDKYFLSIPFARIAVRNFDAATFAAASASLLTFAETETDALRRTASGVTFTVPVELTLMYRVGVAASADCVPIVEARTESAITASTRVLLDAEVFMRQE